MMVKLTIPLASVEMHMLSKKDAIFNKDDIAYVYLVNNKIKKKKS